MICGIPVVATAVNSVPEVVISGQDRPARPPRGSRSLAGALAYMLDHPDQAAAMAQAAREHVGEQFRADLLGAELMGVYDRALALPPRARSHNRWVRPDAGVLDTAGERLELESDLDWVDRLVIEGTAG